MRQSHHFTTKKTVRVALRFFPKSEQGGVAAKEQMRQNDFYGCQQFLFTAKSDVPNSSKIQNTDAVANSNNPPSNQNATSTFPNGKPPVFPGGTAQKI